MARPSSRVAALATLCLCGACAEPDPPPPVPVVVTHDLTTRWEVLSHRISRLELTFEADADGLGGTLVGENAGGPFGAIDTAVVREAFALYASPTLRALPLSVEVAIPAAGSTSPEAFIATGTARAPIGALADADTLVAWIRGYRVSTDEYATPPPFATDPVLPYAPSEGFTSQGLGIQLGPPEREGAEVVVQVRVRNSLGPSDRGDMNAAIPQATSWVRVDLLVVGAARPAATVTRAELAYTLSTPTYGMGTVQAHATDSAQALTIDGTPGVASGLVGWSGFDLWINAPEHIDPGCAVVQDAVNAWGEPISGPGRYVTELSTRLADARYDALTGRATMRADLFASTTSTGPEIGNLCLGARGEVTLLQVGDDVSARAVSPAELRLRGGRPARSQVRFDTP